MEVSKSDIKTITRYLRDAAAFYRRHVTSVRDYDRARLLALMANKLEKKQQK